MGRQYSHRLWASRYHSPVDYRLTAHAAARIAERSVPADWLAEALHRPQWVLPAAHGREERQSVFERDGKRVLLRVICEADLVITVILTSKFEKYGGSP